MTRLIRPIISVIAVAGLAAGTQAISFAAAQARTDRTLSAPSAASHRALPKAAARAVLTATAAPGSSDVTNLGAGGWEVQSSAVATQTGAQISTPGFNTSTWLPVTNDDAAAPGTEIEALAHNGQCPGD